jgi:hypothetical protein
MGEDVKIENFQERFECSTCGFSLQKTFELGKLPDGWRRLQNNHFICHICVVQALEWYSEIMYRAYNKLVEDRLRE